jgi:hypothetical protein
MASQNNDDLKSSLFELQVRTLAVPSISSYSNSMVRLQEAKDAQNTTIASSCLMFPCDYRRLTIAFQSALESSLREARNTIGILEERARVRNELETFLDTHLAKRENELGNLRLGLDQLANNVVRSQDEQRRGFDRGAEKLERYHHEEEATRRALEAKLNPALEHMCRLGQLQEDLSTRAAADTEEKAALRAQVAEHEVTIAKLVEQRKTISDRYRSNALVSPVSSHVVIYSRTGGLDGRRACLRLRHHRETTGSARPGCGPVQQRAPACASTYSSPAPLLTLFSGKTF